MSPPTTPNDPDGVTQTTFLEKTPSIKNIIFAPRFSHDSAISINSAIVHTDLNLGSNDGHKTKNMYPKINMIDITRTTSELSINGMLIQNDQYFLAQTGRFSPDGLVMMGQIGVMVKVQKVLETGKNFIRYSIEIVEGDAKFRSLSLVVPDRLSERKSLSANGKCLRLMNEVFGWKLRGLADIVTFEEATKLRARWMEACEYGTSV